MMRLFQTIWVIIVISFLILCISCSSLKAEATIDFNENEAGKDVYTNELEGAEQESSKASEMADSEKKESELDDYAFDLLVKTYPQEEAFEFDSLGYAVTETDAELYAFASGLIGDYENEYKMLKYVEYPVDDEIMGKIKQYAKALKLYELGNYSESYNLFDEIRWYLDSNEKCNGILEQGGVVFNVGDTGPAGGVVFYDKGFYSDGWRYLEAYRGGLGKYQFGRYYSNEKVHYYSDNYECIEVGTSSEIGMGKKNTAAIVEAIEDNIKNGLVDDFDYAAKVCMEFNYNGFNDWFLPSKEELEILSNNFGDGRYYDDFYYYANYWTSTEYESSAYDSWVYGSGYNKSYYHKSKEAENVVKPIRAF